MKTNSYSRFNFSFFTKGFILMLVTFLGFTACEVEEPIPTYTLATTISPAEGGKITLSPQAPNYPEGTQVTLTPEPNEHWVFKQWEGDAIGNTNPLQVTMTANTSITGVFVKRDYPLNLKIEGEGTVDEKIVPNPSGREYPHGTRVELKPIPKEGWVFESWGGDLSGTATPQIITVDKEKNVIVKFKRKDYPLNIAITGEGTVEEKIISTPGGRTYPFQTVVQLTPKAKEGWEFESWGGDLTGKETPKNITVDKEKNVTVKFKELVAIPAINTDLYPNLNWNDHSQGKSGTYDLNKDGVPDIITWSGRSSDPKVSPKLIVKDYSGKDIFNFDIRSKNPNIRDSLNNLLLDYRDINNDGFLDFALTYMGEWDFGNATGNNIKFYGVNTYFLFSKGNLNYDITEILDVPNQSQFNINIFDWDFDGLPDLLVSGMNEGIYYKNLGNNKFERRALTPLYQQMINNKYDYDKDGNLDFINLYVNQKDQDGNSSSNNSQVLTIVTSKSVVNMNVTGKTIEKQIYPLNNTTSAERITLLDGDRDGDMDLVIGGFVIENNALSFFQEYFENTGAQFVYKKDFIEIDKSLIGELQVWAQDLDKDGDIDLFYPTYSKSRLNSPKWEYFWWENTGNGFKINKKFKLIY
ncbi:MAG: VCBS repeat-containing protein [Algoriphagus sp.]|nr:VCBS repeat-containing protein [Algoriphagus sp.]